MAAEGAMVVVEMEAAESAAAEWVAEGMATAETVMAAEG